MKNGGHYSAVELISNEIVKSFPYYFRSYDKNIILAQSLGKSLRSSHMQGVCKFVTPSMYF